MDTVSAVASLLTAVAGLFIAYLLQKPYVRAVKMFRGGQTDPKTLKLKNVGPATAIRVVLEDRHGHPIELDLKLGQGFKHVDALAPGKEITVTIPNGSRPVHIYYENLFGLLFRTELQDVGNRFQMVGRKVWPIVHPVSREVYVELPLHRWRRHG